MTDPRVAIYKPYEGRTVRVWISFRPEIIVTGKMRVISTDEGSPEPFAGFVLETEKGPQVIRFGEMRKFELADKAPKPEPRRYQKLSDKTGVLK
jgi:hypothetical protein